MNRKIDLFKWKNGANLFLLIILVFCLTAVLMLPSNPIDSLPGRDNGVFLYGGQQILLGKTPYLDFWDHKGPLIHYINALGLLIGRGSRWGVWGGEFIFLVLTNLGIYHAAKMQWGSIAALASLAGWAYGILVAGSYYHFHDSNYTETYSLLFSVFSVYFWDKAFRSSNNGWYYVLIGLMGGCTFMLRPNNIGPQITIALIEAINTIRFKTFAEGLKRIGYLTFGSLTVLIAVVLFFGGKHALPEFIDSVIGYNLVYRHSGISPFPEIGSAGLSLFNWIPLLAYIVILARFLWGFSKKGYDPSVDAFTLFLLIGWPIEVLFTSLSSRILSHYYITWIPYLSWLVGGVVSAVFAPTRIKVERVSANYLILPILILLVVSNGSAVNKYTDLAKRLIFNRGSGIEKGIFVVNQVIERTEPRDTVLVWGNEVWINFFSGRASPTRYAYQYPLFMPGYTDREKVSFFLGEIQARPPELIVEPTVDSDEILPLNLQNREKMITIYGIPDGMDEIFEFIDKNYSVALTLHDVTIYKLIDADG